MDFARLVKARLLLSLAALAADLTGTNLTEAQQAEAARLDQQLLDRQLPAPLADDHPDNPLARLQRGYEVACVVLEQAGCPAPHALTVTRFYHRLDYLQRQAAQGAPGA